MKRILVALILAVLLLGCTLTVCVSAESLYVKKVVSVVYDNSGSMGGATGQKNIYANYAMQAFCGLLNKDDELYITYMSSPKKSNKVDLSDDTTQSGIDNIRRMDSSIGTGTPWQAVHTAFECLKNRKAEIENTGTDENNDSTQYWLVVITDGAFDEVNNNSNLTDLKAKVNVLNQCFSRIADGENVESETVSYMTVNELENADQTSSIDYNLVFFSISSDSNPIPAPEESKVKGLSVYKATTADEITTQMSSIANLVSGRTRVDNFEVRENPLTSTPENPLLNILTITPKYPLFNIAVLMQKTDVSLKGITADEIELSANRAFHFEKGDTLKGKVYLIGVPSNDSQSQDSSQSQYDIIPSNVEYNLEFSDDISALVENDDKTIVVLFEPALKLKTTFLVNGKNADSLDNVAVGDVITVISEIYEVGADDKTAAPISPDVLPGETKYTMEIKVDGNPVAALEEENKKTLKIESYTLTEDETVIDVCVKLPDAAPIEQRFSVKPQNPKYAVRTVGDEITLNYDRMDEDVSIAFEIFSTVGKKERVITDGDTIESYSPKITVKLPGESTPVEVPHEIKDGKIVFTPTKELIEGLDRDKSHRLEVVCTTDKGKCSTAYNVVFTNYKVVPVKSKDSSIKYTDLSDNKDFKLQFEVYEQIGDDERLLDKKEVEALGYVVNTSPEGNSGLTELTEDGRITFTPNASSGAFDGGDFEVEVTCTVGKVSETASYTIECSSYVVLASVTEKSIKHEKLPDNEEFKVSFNLAEVVNDGNGHKEVIVEDRAFIESLNPKVSVTVDDKTVDVDFTIADDGTIIFTPNRAFTDNLDRDDFDVKVTCTVGNTENSAFYKVLLSKYVITSVDGDEKVKKTEVFENDVSVSFFIEKIVKNGDTEERERVFPKKSDVQVYFNEEWNDLLQYEVEIAPDGVVTVTPYDDEKIDKAGVWGWIWVFDYLTYPGDDVEVTLDTFYGKGEAEINVIPADVGYILLWVVLPGFIELVILLYIIWWILACIFRRPTYPKESSIYTAGLNYDSNVHENKLSLRKMGCVGNMNSETDWFASLGSFLYRIHPPTKFSLHESIIDITRKSTIDGYEFAPDYNGIRVYCSGSVYRAQGFSALYKDKGRILPLNDMRPDSLKDMISTELRNSRLVYVDSQQLDPYEERRDDSGYYSLSANRYYIIDAKVKKINNKIFVTGGTIVYFKA